MRIAFVNTFNDRGGAAKAAFRLFSGVYEEQGVIARFFSRENATGHPGVVADRSRLTALFGDQASVFDQKGLKRRHPGRERVPFSVNRIPDTVHETILAFEPDLVHLHWPHAGFMRLESLAKLGVPLVWTLHDMWAFTGVCHYAGDCRKYMAGCGACPRLKSADRDDVSARVFARKRALYPGLDIHVVCPSAWLAGLAGKSRLLGGVPATVIPNCLDEKVFSPAKGGGDKAEARAALGLPRQGRLVLFGADAALSDPRKGGRELVRAFAQAAPERAPGARLVVFGDEEETPPAPGVLVLGRIDGEETLARLYAACDLYAFPSLEDNLPNTVMEASSCGAPVAAYATGGVPEMVIPGVTGYLAPTGDMAAFLDAVFTALDDPGLTRLGENARKRAASLYARDAVVSRHLELYRAVFARARSGR